MTTTRVMVIGEALVDIVRTDGAHVVEHVGGSPTNVAVGLAHLGQRVDLTTSVARDHRGDRIAAHVERHGVHLASGSRGAARTSTAMATLDTEGAATYDFDLGWAPTPITVPSDVTHIHTGSIAAVLEPGATEVAATLTRARDRRTVSYDPNVRPTIMGDPAETRARVEQVIGLSDVVKSSEDDVYELYPGDSLETVLHHWTDLGPALVVVTRAGEGAVFRVASTGEVAHLPAPSTSVVDTVGAGDSFMAGLLSGLIDLGLLGGLEGRYRLRAATAGAVAPAVERGLACGARTVARAGAYAPALDEL